MILHNLTKIRIFRILLMLSYPVSALLFLPVLLSKRKKGGLFFFFDRYSIGGAQKIHLDILESVKDKQKTIFFTRRSFDKKLKDVFYSIPNSKSTDIHFWCDNLLFRLFSVHYYSFLMNSHEGAVIFSSNSTFFYDMLPFLKKRNLVYEMLHNFTYGKKGMEFFGLANYRYIDQRMVYDTFTHKNLLEQYDNYKVSEEFKRRITFLEYGVKIPDEQTMKDATPPLKILYAGRGAAQKRIWLLNQIAEHFITGKSPVEFTFAGSMSKELSETVRKNSIVHHEIGEQSRMNELYSKAHVIILTSAFEGFPVVIKEGMSYACIPLVTALPGNKSHLTHLQNALLIENFENEDWVVKEGIAHIELLLNQPQLIAELSMRAYQYASENFRKDKFLEAYRTLLTPQPK